MQQLAPGATLHFCSFGQVPLPYILDVKLANAGSNVILLVSYCLLVLIFWFV
jgi:hypothetical protein